MFKNIPAEVLFAEALLKVEPEKHINGSPERREWLKLIMEVEGFILRNNLDNMLFKNVLNGPSCDGVD